MEKTTIEPSLISVIIPAYNCEDYIEKAIDSILDQTYQTLEIVIADDGSTDKTREIIDRYTDPRLKRFHNDENLGNIRTRNKLFDLAQGEFITIQDADDWSHPERLEKQMNAFVKDPELGACGTNYAYVKMSGTIKKARSLEDDIIVKPWSELYLWPPTIMIRRRVYEDIGGLNLYFERLFAEDKYWISLILEKYKVLCLKEPLYYYRFNPVSLTKKLDQPRKLLVTTVIRELLKQRKETGTDWLEQKDYEKLQAFERNLMSNRKWLSEQYRIFSAISIDGLKFDDAISLLRKAVLLYPYKSFHFRTAIYLVKKYFAHTIFKMKLEY